MFRSHSTGRLRVLDGGVQCTRLLGVWRVTVAVHFTGLSSSGNSAHSLIPAGLRRTLACGWRCPGSLLQLPVIKYLPFGMFRSEISRL